MKREPLRRSEAVTDAIAAAEHRPGDYDRCDTCMHARWYHRLAEALGETDHRFKEKEEN